MRIAKDIPVTPGMEERLKELGYSKKTFCGQEVNGVKVRSLSTFDRAVKEHCMTFETYSNYEGALGWEDTYYLVYGDKVSEWPDSPTVRHLAASSAIVEEKKQEEPEKIEAKKKKPATMMDIYSGIYDVVKVLAGMGATIAGVTNPKNARKTVITKLSKTVKDAFEADLKEALSSRIFQLFKRMVQAILVFRRKD